MRGGIQGAVAVNQASPSSQTDQVLAAARDAFTTGMHVAVVVGALIIGLAAVAVFTFLPARALDDPSVTELAGATGSDAFEPA